MLTALSSASLRKFLVRRPSPLGSRVAVGDVEQLTPFVCRVGDRGEFKVRVAVDSPSRGQDRSAYGSIGLVTFAEKSGSP
ncbi:hypothetical protein [Streptomyces sp. NPDC056192]|uniref:hypothetical protein n=1 Tax=Streptomyces sp. NPDC056192 TaxID=3345743 RepID=UPI0035DDB9FA